MQNFSVETAGFVALTLTELLIQECVLKGILTEKDVQRLLKAAKKRHKNTQSDQEETMALNQEAAQMIGALTKGLAPLFETAKARSAGKDRRKSRRKKPPKNCKA